MPHKFHGFLDIRLCERLVYVKADSYSQAAEKLQQLGKAIAKKITKDAKLNDVEIVVDVRSVWDDGWKHN